MHYKYLYQNYYYFGSFVEVNVCFFELLYYKNNNNVPYSKLVVLVRYVDHISMKPDIITKISGL